MAARIEIDSKEFADWYWKLKKSDVELQKALQKRMSGLAKPIVRDVRAAAHAIPSKGELGAIKKKKNAPGLGLRAALAAATVSQFKVQKDGAVLKIRISGTKFAKLFKEDKDGNSRMLPYRMEGKWEQKHPWTHPVFGRNVSVTKDYGKFFSATTETKVRIYQAPHPFFQKAIEKHSGDVLAEVAKAIDDTLDSINKK